MPERIKIEDRYIGNNEPVFIIAEIGSNHNQDINIAKKLIDVAAAGGADAAKFQLFDADELYKPEDEFYSVFKKIQFNSDWLSELKNYTEKKGLVFFASPFDEKSIHLLSDHGISLYKWASSETTNLHNLRIAASYNKPMVISTGMCDLADIFEALEVCKASGNDDIVLLHTSSLYPTEPEDANLKTMRTLKRIFQVHVGFSDHTMSSIAAVAAKALGASVIEKHITIDRKMNGPDHFYSLEPNEFKQYVNQIRVAEKVLGLSRVEMHPNVTPIARRESIHAGTNIQKDEIITKEMIAIERPAGGIKPRFISSVVGATAKRDIKRGNQIYWKDLL